MSKATTDFQRILQEYLNEHPDPKGFLRAFAPVVRGFDRNQPRCSPSNRVRHLSTLLALLMYAEDVEYIVDQITQALAHLPKVENPGYVLTRSAAVLTSEPSNPETPHVEVGKKQNTLLRRLRCILYELKVSSFWIGPGRTNPNGGDESMNHYVLKGIQERIRRALILELKGDRLPASAVKRLEPSELAALFGVSIPGDEPVVDEPVVDEPVVDEPVDTEHNDDEHDEHDEHDEPIKEVDMHKTHEQAAFVPVYQGEEQFQQPPHVVFVQPNGYMMVQHLSEEVQYLNEQIAHLMKVNNDQSRLLDYFITTHGYSGQGVQFAYSPFPIGDE